MADGPAVNIDIDVARIGEDIVNGITNLVNSNANRQSFVVGVEETIFFKFNQKMNVMVFNLGQNFDRALNNVQLQGTTVFQGLTFSFWAFESGEFTNQGDGGFINWAFAGIFTRDATKATT